MDSSVIAPARRRTLVALSSAAAALATAGWPLAVQAQATGYPNKPLRLVVPFGAGGSDTMARVFAEKLGALLKQQVLVENKPGAAAVIGSEHVAQSPADGYTLLFLGGGSLTPVLIKDLRFDLLKSLRSVVALARGGMTFMVNGALPVKTFPEFVGWAKTQGGKLNYSHTAGSILLSTEMLKSKAGFEATPIPYKGAGQVLQALVTNEIQMTIDVPFNYLPMIKEGKVRPLVHGGAERSPTLPDVPTLAEVGLADLQFAVTHGIWIHPATPEPIVQQLNAAFNEVLKDPEIRQRLAQAAMVPVGGGTEVHAKAVAAEHAMWAVAAQKIGYRPE